MKSGSHLEDPFTSEPREVLVVPCGVRGGGGGRRAGGGGNKSKDLLARSVAHTHYRMSNGQI